jgi:hypothetical protein
MSLLDADSVPGFLLAWYQGSQTLEGRRWRYFSALSLKLDIDMWDYLITSCTQMGRSSWPKNRVESMWND